MKHKKITSVIISVAMCISLSIPSVSVIADETPDPSGTQIAEETEKKETKESVPKETNKQEPSETETPKETGKSVPEEEKTTETQDIENKEPEAAETDKPEETSKQEPAITEEEKKSDTENKQEETPESQANETPKESEPAVTDVPKTPDQSTSSKAKKWWADDVSIKNTNGILSWTLTERYRIDELVINGSPYYNIDSNSTSCNLKEAIDYLIKNNRLDKTDDDYYEICLWIATLDDEGWVCGMHDWTCNYRYHSSAIPNQVDTIKNIKYTNGVLSWEEYPNDKIYCYNFYISSRKFAYKISRNYLDDATCDLNGIESYIDKLIESGKIKKQDSYLVTIKAVESVFKSGEYDYYQFAAMGNITINYKSSAKAPNTLYVKGGKTAKVKYKKLKKKKQTVARSKLMTVSGAKGRLAYKIVSVNKKKSSFKINANTGAVTLKKKLKKGTYTLTVLVTAAGNDDYKPDSWYVTFKIKVK